MLLLRFLSSWVNMLVLAVGSLRNFSATYSMSSDWPALPDLDCRPDLTEFRLLSTMSGMNVSLRLILKC